MPPHMWSWLRAWLSWSQIGPAISEIEIPTISGADSICQGGGTSPPFHFYKWLGTVGSTSRKQQKDTDQTILTVTKQRRIHKFWKGGGRQFISPRSHLSQMHTTIYRPFTQKKAAFWKKIWNNRGRHHCPPPMNPPLSRKRSRSPKRLIVLVRKRTIIKCISAPLPT